MSAPMPAELIDLKFLPSWVKEEERNYSDFQGEEDYSSNRTAAEGGRQKRPEGRDSGRGKNRGRKPRRRDDERQKLENWHRRPAERATSRFRPESGTRPSLPQLDIRFLPKPAGFENVVEQIKASHAAYSIYALARLFLQKPERYNVRLTAPEQTHIFRLEGTNAVSIDRPVLENSAFMLLKDKYYKVEVTMADPVKGNFASVARERSSGVLLGPTNHHSYQTQLRRLYEQRFSRRMPFPEFQRHIEIVTDPILVERWKEDARKVTTFTTCDEDPPRTFASESDADRYFRERYLPVLLTEVSEAEIDGVSSRTLRDRRIARVIEDAWTAEVRSPSKMMQELAGRLRGAGLQVFRHRKGMLFVSPIRPKPLNETAVADSVRSIVEAIRTSPRITRKQLADKLIQSSEDHAGKLKLALAADLHWLVREGHVIEFSDGSLDLPRSKDPALRGATFAGSSAERPMENRQESVNANPHGVDSQSDSSDHCRPHVDKVPDGVLASAPAAEPDVD